MKKVEAIIRPETLLVVEQGLEERGFGGFTLADVRGHGNQAAERGTWRGEEFELHVVHKILISVLCEDEEAPVVVETILNTAKTGAVGDGIVTVTDVAAVFVTRTGERVSADA
ncbi:MAG: P-II family nitrogen regulator [Actinomycetota bacterium]|nr:P-II family nitrogen regulator [Actinomycetota bacterium]